MTVFDEVGLIPGMLDPLDPRKAVEQLHAGYSHGGGWRAFHGFTMDPETHVIRYPGDEPLAPRAMILFREESIFIYPCAWVAVVQPDKSFEICRMD
jgi:hypothetical protein